MKIAIVYDWFDKWGGVERVLLIFKKIFPKADFFTSYTDKKKSWFNDFNIKESFLGEFPDFIKKNRILSLPFYPLVFESFDFSDYDLIISITAYFAKGVITKPKTKHICYLLTPPRFLWTHNNIYFNNKQFIFNPYLNYLKKWDFLSARRLDKIISISKTVQKRCFNIYKIKSQVIYPPFDLNYWQKVKDQLINKNDFNLKKIIPEKYYLLVSRLEPYKKVDLVINLFNKLNKNLIIVGEGSLLKKLRNKAKRNIIFFQNLTDLQLGFLYTNAFGLIMPQEEDFGYVSLESQFFNCPVISYKKGGVLETIIEDKTGVFFEDQKEESLLKTIARFEKIRYNLKNNLSINKKNLNNFSINNFIDNFKKTI